jgi:hypothetical protein
MSQWETAGSRGVLCILAARFYRELTQSSTSSNAKLLRNHISKEQAAAMVGLSECAEITRRLIQTYEVEGQPSHEQCVDVICTLVCNLFTIADDFQNEAGVGCYPYAAMLNHSCEPNCVQRFDAEAGIVIRTVRDVSVGEELCISYTDTGMPTWYRQQELLQSYHFHCQCARCSRWDGLDGYACNVKGSAGEKTTSGTAQCTGTCRLSTATSYRQWIAGSPGIPYKSKDQTSHAPQYPLFLRALPELHRLLEKEGLRGNSASGDISFICSACGMVRSEKEIAGCVQDLATTVAEQRTARETLKGLVPALTSQEQLYLEVMRFRALLNKLQRLVPTHHYSILHLRKMMKTAMEEFLPVVDGTLLFQPLASSSAVAAASKRLRPCSGRGAEEPACIPALELQQLYQDNLRSILACTQYCYSTSVPNLCHTYFSRQYLWFVLTKHTSVVDSRGARVEGLPPDLSACRELLEGFPRLVRTVTIVYGGDHPFTADLARCHGELLRLLSC